MECNEFGRLMFDGKIVYCKDGDGLIPYWQGVTEEGLEKFVRDYAERGTEGFADFIICQNGEVLETIESYFQEQIKAEEKDGIIELLKPL